MSKTYLTLLTWLALVLLPCGALAADLTYGSAQPFTAGDNVAFVGDSITHGGTYHSIVTLFYATRFPERPVSSYNAGIGGDRASMIMADERYRLNVDILGRKPNVATIMLGMNDVGGGDYGAGKDGPEFLQRRQASLDIYSQNMNKLITALQKSGARVTLITPSIYDETTKLEKANPVVQTARNAALTKCADMVRAWSKEYNTGIVNFHEVMNTITAREQKKDPAFTIVGPDRVHPGPVGHFVMGYTLLKAQGMPREVARIGVDAKQAKSGDAANCEISGVKKAGKGVEFDALEKALPMVLPEEAAAALKLVPFVKDLNQEILLVKGLGKGRYELKIDGEVVGEYSAAELKAGVNLAENSKTPQYRQSAAATKINSERTAVQKQMRDIVAQKYGMSRAKINVSDNQELLTHVKAQIEAARQANKPVVRNAELLLQDLMEPGKLEQKSQDLAAALTKACQPRKHHFALAKK